VGHPLLVAREREGSGSAVHENERQPSLYVTPDQLEQFTIFSKRNLCANRLTHSCSLPRHSFVLRKREKLSSASFRKRSILRLGMGSHDGRNTPYSGPSGGVVGWGRFTILPIAFDHAVDERVERVKQRRKSSQGVENDDDDGQPQPHGPS
jgi:hypothetical protein